METVSASNADDAAINSNRLHVQDVPIRQESQGVNSMTNIGHAFMPAGGKGGGGRGGQKCTCGSISGQCCS